MNQDGILSHLEPPAGGWQRLLTRRDTTPGWQKFGLPIAAACALVLVVVLLRQQPSALQLPWNGGRLVARPSEDVGLQVLTHGRATALPSDDARVRFYWLQDTDEP